MNSVQQPIGGGADEHVRARPITAELDAVIAVDAEGAVLEWSAAAEELFGTPRSVALGLDLVELIVPAGLRESVRETLLDEGRSEEECLAYGVACGAESTQHFGAGTVDRNQVERLLGGVSVLDLEVPAEV